MTKADDKNPQEKMTDKSDFSHWQLPDVTPVVDVPKENMFGRFDKHREVKEVEKAVMPPTLAEIEAIRAEAEAEGLAQGQQQGFEKGREEGRLKGLEEGHQQGFTQGETQGLQQGLAQAQQSVQQFEAIMQQLSAPLSLVDTEIEQALVNLSMTLAKAVIGHELYTHPEHILSALRKGVDSLPMKEQGAHLRLHPDDLRIVEQLYDSQQLTRNRWELESDPTLQRGECIVSNNRSTVDMGLETRIKAVFDGLVHSEERLEQQKLQQQAEMEKVPEVIAQRDVGEPASETEGEQEATAPSQATQADESVDLSQENVHDEDPSKPTT